MSFEFEKEIEQEVEAVFKAKTVRKAKDVVASKHGQVILGLISFFESATPFPIITDPFFIAAVMLDRGRVVRLTIITIVSSALGGVAAYFTALFFFDLLSSLMPATFMNEFNALVNNNQYSTTALTLIGAVTPVPYTTTAWVIAALKGNVLVFFVASLFGRGIRYGLVGYATYRFGNLAIGYAKRYTAIASVVVLLLAALYFWHKLNM